MVKTKATTATGHESDPMTELIDSSATRNLLPVPVRLNLVEPAPIAPAPYSTGSLIHGRVLSS